jgi:hypothetical protein
MEWELEGRRTNEQVKVKRDTALKFFAGVYGMTLLGAKKRKFR